MRRWMALSVAFLMCGSALAVPPWSSDTGKITTLFTTTAGTMAVMLDGGYPNALADGQCPVANGFAGFLTADPAIKSALLAAKASGSSITIITVGCAGGSSWYGLSQVYVH